jgi:hypothetical protein
MRFAASQLPLIAPKRSTAVMAYSEQVGTNRQRCPKSGLSQRLYRRSAAISRRSIKGVGSVSKRSGGGRESKDQARAMPKVMLDRAFDGIRLPL